MLENTPLVLTAFYVNFSIQFTLVGAPLHGCCVGFGWTRLLLCLLNAPWITSLECYYWKYSLLSHNNASHIWTSQFFLLSPELYSLFQFINYLQSWNNTTFWLLTFDIIKGQLSKMGRPHEWYSMEESVLDHHSRSSLFKSQHRSYWILLAKVACENNFLN